MQQAETSLSCHRHYHKFSGDTELFGPLMLQQGTAVNADPFNDAETSEMVLMTQVVFATDENEKKISKRLKFDDNK